MQRLPSGRRTSERTREQRCDKRKRSHAPVDVQLVQARDPGRRERDYALHGEDGEDEADRAAGNGQKKSFHHVLQRNPVSTTA